MYKHCLYIIIACLCQNLPAIQMRSHHMNWPFEQDAGMHVEGLCVQDSLGSSGEILINESRKKAKTAPVASKGVTAKARAARAVMAAQDARTAEEKQVTRHTQVRKKNVMIFGLSGGTYKMCMHGGIFWWNCVVRIMLPCKHTLLNIALLHFTT